MRSNALAAPSFDTGNLLANDNRQMPRLRLVSGEQETCLENFLPSPHARAIAKALQPQSAPRKITVTYGRLASGQSVYGYVGGNPLSYVDPMGLSGGGWGLYYLERELLRQAEEKAAAAKAAEVKICPPPSTVGGSLSNPLKLPANVPPINAPGEYGGMSYSGHAFDQLQNRGIPPSVANQAVTNGMSYPSRDFPDTTIYYDPTNNVSTVVGNTSGKIVTVLPYKAP